MIAAGARVAESVVRYHIAISAEQPPELRTRHQAALPPTPPRVTEPGQRNVQEILALFDAEGGRSIRQSALAGWLTRR